MSEPTGPMSGMRTPVADLLHHPAARRRVRLDEPLAALVVGGAAVAETTPVTVDVVLERVPDGLVARGEVGGTFEATCSRCLAPLVRQVSVPIGELFEPNPLEGQTYPLEGDEVDLEPVVRDALLLELPAAPLCRVDCRGLCPVCGGDRNSTPCECDATPPDPRWDALRDLRL